MADLTFPRVVGSRPGNLREVDDGLFICGLLAFAWEHPFDTVVVFQRPEEATYTLYGSRKPSVKQIAEYQEEAYGPYRSVVFLPMEDGDVFKKSALDRAWEAVSEAEGPVAFHCAAGISRSVSAMYAMLRVLGHDHGEAFRRVLSPCGQRPMDDTLNSARRWAENR